MLYIGPDRFRVDDSTVVMSIRSRISGRGMRIGLRILIGRGGRAGGLSDTATNYKTSKGGGVEITTRHQLNHPWDSTIL